LIDIRSASNKTQTTQCLQKIILFCYHFESATLKLYQAFLKKAWQKTLNRLWRTKIDFCKNFVFHITNGMIIYL